VTISPDIERDQAGAAGGHRVGTSRAVPVLAAVVGALLIWAVADPLAGVDLSVGTGSSAKAVGPGAVTIVSLLAGLAAVGLATLLARVTPRPRRTWSLVAVSTLVLSLVGPLGAASPAAGVSLGAMHLVVGATLVLGVGRTIEARRVGA
jgi:Family of unknown function (DUF6069)